MKTRFMRTLTYLFGWPLTILAFLFVGKIIMTHSNEILGSLKNLNWLFLLGAIITFVIYFFLRAYFWWRMLEINHHNVLFKEINFLWGSTEMKRFIPGNIWSVLSRSNALTKKAIPLKTTLSLQLIEVQYITIASFVLSLFAINFIVFGVLPPLPLAHLAVSIITIGVLILIILFLFLKKLITYYSPLKRLDPYIPSYRWEDNLKLLLIATTALFLFGLGTYFSISAITFLYIRDITTLIGFFVFALLIGYISFITPMGLGVREGIITIGLSKYTSLPLASFGAIFARIVFIISEIIFLGLSYLWYKSQHHIVKKIERFIQTNRYAIFLTGMIVCYSIYFVFASFARYDNYYAGRFDLGNMDQTVWNTVHGRIFQTTDPNGTNIISRLAFHADFILILLAPLYMLWQDPRMLLLIQTLVLSFGAIFVYLITSDVLKKRNLGLLFAALYCINPSINYTNLYDFHGVTLATTFILGAFYFMKRKKWLWYIVFLMLAGLTKEEVWIIVAFFGLVTLIVQKKKFLGAIIFFASVAIAFFLILKAIPMARGGEHFALSYYSDFGSSPFGIIKSIVTSPYKTIATLLGITRLVYLFELFSPLGFLSFAGLPFLLFPSGDLVADLLSNNANLHQIYYQYTATITPFVFISAIYGFRFFIKRWIPPYYLASYLLVSGILSAYFFGPLPFAKNPNVTMFITPINDKDIIENFLATIPKNLSVATTNNLGSHLSRRQKIYTIPVGIDQADIILFLLNDPAAQPSLEAQITMSEKMKRDRNYIELFRLHDFVVFEKRNLYMHPEPNLEKVKLYPLSIPALQKRDYIGGQIMIEKQLADNTAFTTYRISYPSDGLTIFGIMHKPKRAMPSGGFPVVIINHDFVSPHAYDPLKVDTAVEEYLARNGFLVIKPDYRNNSTSDQDTSLPVALSYPIDTLNLFSSIPSILEANPENIFLWGHSVGSIVSLTSVQAHDQNPNFSYPIRGVSLWAPFTDPYVAYTRMGENFPQTRSPYTKTVNTLGSPTNNPMLWKSISPIYYLDDITTPIHITQGLSDTILAYQLSIELYNDLKSFNKPASLKLYEYTDHNFKGKTSQALKDTVIFFRKVMRK